MYYILLTAQQTATQAGNAAQEAATQAPSNDIMGIGGIISTLLVGYTATPQHLRSVGTAAKKRAAFPNQKSKRQALWKCT